MELQYSDSVLEWRIIDTNGQGVPTIGDYSDKTGEIPVFFSEMS